MQLIQRPCTSTRAWLRSGCRLTLLLVTLLALAATGPARTIAGATGAQPDPPFLVRDFSPAPYQPGFWADEESVEVNGTFFFSGWDDHSGNELWKSDGTAAGTVLVRDIFPGSGDSAPFNLTNFNETLFFFASDSSRGVELWKSDGTETGTTLVRDIRPGTASSASLNDRASWLQVVNGTLFFVADDGIHGKDLWRSDGTWAGTSMAIDLPSGPDGQGPGELTNVNGTLFFRTESLLWKSDGTAEGTVQLPIGGSDLTAVGEYLFFNCSTAKGTSLCRSDGTPAGTIPLVTLEVFASYLTDFNGRLAFVSGGQLWRSDGTPASTVMIEDFTSSAIEPTHLTTVGTSLFFLARDTTTVYFTWKSIWKSDGTPDGTVKVADLPAVPTPELVGTTPTVSTGSSDGLFMVIILAQLWSSDGTADGTLLLFDAASPPLTAVQGGWYFRSGLYRDMSLMRTNGTPEGTITVKANVAESNPLNGWMVEAKGVGGSLFYTWSDEYSFWELWRSDGTASGTVLLKEESGDNRGYYLRIENLTPFNSTLFFLDRQGAWKSDGTATGTVLVKGDSWYGCVRDMENISGKLFFTNCAEVWQSDGTADGTVLFCRIKAEQLTDVGGTLFFAEGNSIEWTFDTNVSIGKCDGSVDGAILLGDFPRDFREVYHGYRFLYPIRNLVAAGGTLFFSTFYTNPTSGISGLWRSDGTPDGTILLTTGVSINLTAVGGTLFFTMDDGISGMELWKSDGTPNGTVRVKDIFPGAWGSNPHALTAVDEILFFAADDGRHGVELWRSDGTPGGTLMVAELMPGPDDAAPAELTSASGVLRFSAWRSGSGVELWESDGTAAGTRMVQDIAPGSQSSNPSKLTATDNLLYFIANDGSAGLGLWASPLTLASRPFRAITVGVRALIQAEDYDRGGEGLAYHDSDVVNHSGLYRNGGVDLRGSGDGSDSYEITHTQADEWLNYTVDIASTQTYTLEARLAAQGSGGVFHIMVDGADLTGLLQVPDTGGWDSWQTIRRPGLLLEAGRHTLSLVLDAEGSSGYVGDFNWLALDAATERVYMPVIRQ
ncbi:MAG: carbohydrate-binding protein [Chloroflexales bacterium]|nr:carbohydrate-binding protein [Chloroflexales bacterium]